MNSKKDKKVKMKPIVGWAVVDDKGLVRNVKGDMKLAKVWKGQQFFGHFMRILK